MNIYRANGKFYHNGKRMSGRFAEMYAWREMNKVGIFFLPTSNKFVLDDYGFEKYRNFNYTRRK